MSLAFRKAEAFPFVIAIALSSGCVTGRASRATLTESAQGPSTAPVSGAPVVPQTAPADVDDEPHGVLKPGYVWIRGYWHWDGVRYTWERGRWEQAVPAGTPPGQPATISTR